MSHTWSFFSCESVICFVTCTLPVLNSAVLPVIIVIYFLVSTVPVIMIGGPVIPAAIE